MTKSQQAERADAIAKLREWIKPGDTVYTILRNVSRSGMSREIGVVVPLAGETRPFVHPNYLVAKAIGERIGKRDGVIVGGCGMDMGFHLVYSLSHALFPQGFGIEGELPDGSKVRPTTKEHAAQCVKAGAKFRGRNGDASGWDDDGGYALRQEWL